MGNCQGKNSAANVQATSRVAKKSLDVNKPIPTPVKTVESKSGPVSPTVPTTPEDEKKQIDAPVAASSTDTGSNSTNADAAKKDTEIETEPEDQEVEAEAKPEPKTEPDSEKAASIVGANSVDKSEAGTAVREVTMSGSDVKSTVSDVPCFRSESGAADTETAPAAVTTTEQESSFETTPTGFTDLTESEEVAVEEKTNKGFMDKVENLRDTCCGAPSDLTAPENNTSEIETNPSMTQSISSSDPNYKQKRKLSKKLREIEAIEAKDKELLTKEQLEKLATKESVLQSIAEL